MGTVTITSDGKNLQVETKKEAVVHKVVDLERSKKYLMSPQIPL